MWKYLYISDYIVRFYLIFYYIMRKASKKGSEKEVFVDKAKEISFSKLASLSKGEKASIISFLKKQIGEPGYEIPAYIFDNDSLSSLEAIVKYAVEELNLGFTEISRLINRSDKTIWTTYQKASKKLPKRFVPKKSKFFIPLKILENRKLSVLENIVVFLKESCMLSFNEISSLINRKYRTILTVYSRSIKKRAKNEP